MYPSALSPSTGAQGPFQGFCYPLYPSSLSSFTCVEGKALATNGFAVLRLRASAGGCFGIRFVAAVAHISYKSNNFFSREKQPPSEAVAALLQVVFGIGLVSAVARYSYNSKDFFSSDRQPPNVAGQLPRVADFEPGSNERIGVSRVGDGGVVGVGCVLHGVTVVELGEWGQWGGVRVARGALGAPLGSCLRGGDECGRPPSCALRTGFDRLRANGFANGPCDGVCRVRSASKSVVGGGGPAPRPCPAGPAAPRSPLRFPSGRTASQAPPLWIPAFAGMTVGGLIAGMGGWWRRGEFPLLRDGRFANRPYDGGVRSAGKSVVGGGGPVPAPAPRVLRSPVHPSISLRANGLQGPAPLDTGFRRYDGGGCGDRGRWCEGVVPACEVRPFDRLRANGFRSVPTVFGSRGCEWLAVGVPSPARVWVRAFTGMTRAGGPSTGSGRAELRIAPTTGWGGRSAGKSVVGGGGPAPRPCPAGPAAPLPPFDFPQGERPPRPRPSGYRLSPVRRWGVCGPVSAVGCGGGPALAGRAIRESPLRWGRGSRGCDGGWGWGCPARWLFWLAKRPTRGACPISGESGTSHPPYPAKYSLMRSMTSSLEMSPSK